MGRTTATMTSMQRHFEKRGYHVLNIDYPSRKYTVAELARRIKPAVEEFNVDATKKIHFVGYSMGGLVIRAFIAKYRPENLGRVVLIGTPNGGSEVADYMHGRWTYKSFFGPAGQELTTEQRTAGTLEAVDYDIGCIAGDRTVDPISTYLIIGGADDGKVSVKSATAVKGVKDTITLHASHTFIPVKSDVIKQARWFIENGKFRHEKEKPTH